MKRSRISFTVLPMLLLLMTCFLGRAELSVTMFDVYQAPQDDIYLELPSDYDEIQADPANIELHPIRIKTIITIATLVEI